MLILKTVAALLVLSAIVVLAVVRLSPSDPRVWHVEPQVTGNEDMEIGVKRMLDGNEMQFQRLDQIIRDTARTRVLAGSVAEGHVTYVTRSRVIGFPDYASVTFRDGRIKIHSRLRFGGSDLGVNKARVDGWLQALRQGGGQTALRNLAPHRHVQGHLALRGE